jgi:hypothetical protein
VPRCVWSSSIRRELKIAAPVPHELDRKKAVGRRMPAKRGGKQSAPRSTRVDGEGGVTGFSRSALAANQTLG